MRLVFSKNLRPKARVRSSRFQSQLEVSSRPSVFFNPRLWMSVINTSRPASFMVLVMPNSRAALIELMVSPLALANPRISAFEFCAWIR